MAGKITKQEFTEGLKIELESKATTTALNLKADTTTVNLKADKKYVDDTNDQTYDSVLQASKTYVGETAIIEGQSHYGVKITDAAGLDVTATTSLMRTIMSKDSVIKIQSRLTTASAWKDVLYFDASNILNFSGVVRGADVYIGGEDNKNGVMMVMDSEGLPVAEVNATTDTYAFPVLNVGDFYAPNVVRFEDYTNEDRIIYVAEAAKSGVGAPDDTNTGETLSSPLRTIEEALRRVPMAFKGIVEIRLIYGQTFDEDIVVSGYVGGGELIINSSADDTTTRPKLSGSLAFINNGNFVQWKNINIDSTTNYAGIFCKHTSGKVVNSYINGASGDTTNGINCNSGANFELYDVAYANVTTAVRSSYGGSAFAYNNTGKATGTAYVGAGGGIVSGSGTAPTGVIANTSEVQGGKVFGTFSYPTPAAAPAPIAVATKKTWTATTDSGTYRHDFGGKWDAGTYYGSYVTQGKWESFGHFTGGWFFGSALSAAVNGRTIKSIRVYAERVRGGYGSSIPVKFRPHTSNTRPSGNVSIQTPEYSVGFKVGEAKWITLPTSFHAGFKNGTYKGIGIYSGTSYYAKMKKGAKIEITYV